MPSMPHDIISNEQFDSVKLRISEDDRYRLNRKQTKSGIDYSLYQGITEPLRFRVDPHPQGLVGEAYAGKSIVYDENLLQTNSVDYQ